MCNTLAQSPAPPTPTPKPLGVIALQPPASLKASWSPLTITLRHETTETANKIIMTKC